MLPVPPTDKTGWPWTIEPTALVDRGKQWPKITVVTPSYMQGQFLEETIRSVLLQSYPNLEYIVMDGGSTDNSVEILQKYAPYLSYWVSEPDNGQADAINKGFARSTGEIMGWLNSDDLLLPNALFHIAEAFEKNSAIQICCGFRNIIDAANQHIGYWGALPTHRAMKYECYVAQETVYWCRKVWQELGSLDSEFHYALDYEYWQRVIKAGYHFTLLPYFLGCFRTHSSSKGSLLEATRERELRKIYSRYLGKELSGQEVVNQLGPQWMLKRLLLKDLWHFRFFVAHPGIVVTLLRLLEVNLIALPVLIAYRGYRLLRRR